VVSLLGELVYFFGPKTCAFPKWRAALGIQLAKIAVILREKGTGLPFSYLSL